MTERSWLDSVQGIEGFGYSPSVRNGEELLHLSEVSIVASPEALRALAAFFLHAAALIEAHPHRFEHEHLREFRRDLPEGLDVVISRKHDQPDAGRPDT